MNPYIAPFLVKLNGFQHRDDTEVMRVLCIAVPLGFALMPIGLSAVERVQDNVDRATPEDKGRHDTQKQRLCEDILKHTNL
jgi:hypothetical protein